MQWADIVLLFNAQFPLHKRDRGALECRHYGFQFFSKVNKDRSFVLMIKGRL